MITVNGRKYNLPDGPVVVICYDGCDPNYIADSAIRGTSPAITSMARTGFYASGLSAMPSFTNPNNVSIVCGAPPSVHGISGNYWFDRETGKEVMMVNEGPLAAPTILAEMAKAGVKVAAVTAKDKLRGALAAGLVGPGKAGIAFSAEKADQCTLAENGVDAADVMSGRTLPDQYSPDLSLFVLDAGVRLVETGRADLLYLSLSDFVQHAHAPGARESDDFMQAVDARVERLLALGATVGIVADHGMTDLSLHDGEPNILYLGDLLDERFGAGGTKVICPITDHFVRHHGALGGFVRVHILDKLDRDEVLRFISSTPGVHTALVREEACRKLELNFEREGDIAVIAAKGVALGSRKGAHQLEQLAGARLRSHGSFAERDVPFVVSRPISAAYLRERGDGPIYNYDIFHFVLNGVE